MKTMHAILRNFKDGKPYCIWVNDKIEEKQEAERGCAATQQPLEQAIMPNAYQHTSQINKPAQGKYRGIEI